MVPRLAALGLLVALTCAAKPFPEAPRSYVYNENVVSPQDAAQLGAQLSAVERQTGHQFVVALFQSLDGESLEDYTHRLFAAWKIGDKKLDDGLLFALFQQDRRWRVEVGYGLEGTITDLEAAEFARAGVPYFRRGDYAGGLRVVVDGLARRLESGPSVRPPAESDPLANPMLWVVVILVVWFILQTMTMTRTNRLIGRRSSSYGGWGGGGWGDGGGGGFSGGGGMSGGGGASGGW